MTLRWPRGIAVTVCGLVGFLLPAGVGLVNGFPIPHIHDEFSYLLGADTFAHGRLTNPTPPLPEYFEAPHVLVVPSYNTKYPPGQSLVLAFGQSVFGHPIWGVWVSCGAFAASLCWMLQVWTSRQWALVTSILMTVTLGTSTYWAQSYWGGMVPMCGGALLYGGVRRILYSPRVGSSIAMATGLLILAITRPYEGMLVSLPAGILLLISLRPMSRLQKRALFTSCIAPAGVVLIAGAAGILAYNAAVTGDWRRSPYDVHLDRVLLPGGVSF